MLEKIFHPHFMTVQHKNAAEGRWQKFTLIEQMANIGSEVFRSIQWKNKGNKEYSRLAFFRALELFDLTLSDKKNFGRLKEVARAREVLVDFLYGDNVYGSTDASWQNYFYAFNYAARVAV